MTLIFTAARWLGLPGMIVAGLVLFYEGIPLARHIPLLERFGDVGHIVAGRVEIASRRAVLAERQAWKRRVTDAREALLREQAARDAEIAAVNAKNLEEQARIEREAHAAGIKLAEAIQQEREREMEREGISCLDRRIDPGVLQSIDN